MSEERTKDLNGKKSFEELVFARFDAMDARFNAVDERFDTVGARLEKLEARSYDTKPIWEKALTAIVATGKEVGEMKNRVAVIETAIAGLITTVEVLKTDVGVLKTDVAGLNTNYGGIKNEFVDIRRELRENVRHELALILKFLIEDRQDIRDAEDRIRQLETKLA